MRFPARKPHSILKADGETQLEVGNRVVKSNAVLSFYQRGWK